MIELRLAGIHDDGENLVLKTADGTSYLLPIDQNLRTSIAKARRIQPLRGLGGSAVFGPRDIQTRFRQGASVEEIVAESGWDANRVRKYEWPIIAERSHIIAAAGKAKITETGAGSNSASLQERLESVISQYGLEEVKQEWTTYQQESGQWTVSLNLLLTDEQKNALPTQVLLPARWSYNPANQGIYASNDAAYFLMGLTHKKQDETVQPAQEAATTAPKVDFARQAEPSVQAHSTVASKLEESTQKLESVEAPSEDSAPLEERTGTRDFASASERKLADLLERARRASAAETSAALETKDVAAEKDQSPAPALGSPAQSAQSQTSWSRGIAKSTNSLESVGTAENTQATADAEVSAAQASVGMTNAALAKAAAPTESTASSTDKSADTPQVATSVRSERDAAGSSWRSQIQTGSEPAPTSSTEENAPADSAAEEEVAPRSNKPKRAAVPSWDDIIFGNQRR